MELKQLQFLVACAETQSFSKAASILFTAQSNVSKVIKSLEDELGIELFERKQYGIVLTEKGKQVYDYAYSTLEQAQKIVDFSRRDFDEELRISCNPSSWMSSAFCDYYREFHADNVSYSIITATTEEIIRRLVTDMDQLGFIYVMEEQLSVLQKHLERNHLAFSLLKRTKAILYTGNKYEIKKELQNSDLEEQQKEDCEIRMSQDELLGLGQIRLVQGYEDEFTLKSFWNNEEHSGDHTFPRFKVAVTTNSDYVMNDLLSNSDLGNISGEYLSARNEKNGNVRTGISLYGDREPVLFGCLIRNDKNMPKGAVHFLNFVKKRLQ